MVSKGKETKYFFRLKYDRWCHSMHCPKTNLKTK